MTKDNDHQLEEIGQVSINKKPVEVESESISSQNPTAKSAPNSNTSNKTGKSGKSKAPIRPKAPAVKGSFSTNEKMRSWYYNRYQSTVVQRNILLLFALLSMVAVTVCVIFVRSVTVSKSLDPYVIEIEEKTGIPIVVEQLSTEYLTGNQMIIRYFLNQYVHSASGYDPRTYKLDNVKVRLFSNSSAYKGYRRRINQRVLGTDSSIEVRIKSIQFPAKNSAQIRILKVIKQQDLTNTVNELINMDFKFVDLKLNSEERLINPLGFQVGRYLTTEEVYKY